MIKYSEAFRKELIETLREASKNENPTEMEQKMFSFVIDLWRIIRKEETKSKGDVKKPKDKKDIVTLTDEVEFILHMMKVKPIPVGEYY